jgi:hypothetical protein
MSDDATNIRVVLAEKAWQEGYAAGRQGIGLEANPYLSARPRRRREIEGKAKRLKVVDN